MLTFGDLSPDLLAEHAFNLFVYQGRHPLGARLIYEALKQDPYHVLSLRCLADLLNQEGFELFSAITLEYALIYMESNSEAEINAFEELLFYSKWSWGFIKHENGEESLLAADFKDSSQFEIQHEKYQTFIDQLLGKAGSLEAAFKISHRLCGIMAQFLEHQDKARTAHFNELFNADQFFYNEQYQQWLQSYEPKLDQLVEQRLVDDLGKESRRLGEF